MFLFLGCENKDDSEKEVKAGDGILLEEGAGGVQVSTEEAMYGAKIYIRGDVDSSDLIFTKDYIAIVQEDREGVEISFNNHNFEAKKLTFTLNSEAKELGIELKEKYQSRKRSDSDIIVHAKYSHIWAWNKNGAAGNLFSSWPGEAMTDEGNTWYKYTILEAYSLNLLFSNSGNDKTSDLSISASGEYWYNGEEFLLKNPDDEEENEEEIGGIELYAEYTHIWAWNKNGVAGNLFSSWPGETMEDIGNGWYKYTFSDAKSINLIFSNSGNDKTSDLLVSQEGQYWYDGSKLVTENLTKDITPPEVLISPSSSKVEGNIYYYEAKNLDISLGISDNQDSSPKAYYTVDGSTAGLTDKLYVGELITVSDGMELSVYAIDKDGNSAVNSFVFDLDADITAPEVSANPAAGRYVEGTVLNVKLTATDNKDTTPNIYYTTNGIEPKAELAYLYSGETITVSSNTSIKTLTVDVSGNETNKNFNYYIGSVNRNDFRQETIYFAITTRFYDGDSSNNVNCWDEESWFNNPPSDPAWRGDFKGLIEKLDYIKALGFTAVWINPPVKNASGIDYHGYHAVDFTEIDPRYDTNGNGSAMDEYQDLIDEVHARGMKIIQDIVINHTGNFGEENLFPLFEMDSNLGENGGYANLDNPELMEANSYLDGVSNGYFGTNYKDLISDVQYSARISAMKEDDTDVEKIYHHEKSMSYESYTEQIGQMAGDCVDLNTENPDVADYLREAYNKYIDMGVDAFRIDTVKHVSRLSFNKEYIPQWNERGGENFYMFGEVCTRVREVWNKGIAADSAPFYTWKESKNYPWGDEATNSVSTRQLWDDNADTSGQPTSDNAFLNGNEYHEPDYSMNSGMGVIDFAMHWNFYEARNAFSVALGGDKYYNDATWNVVYVDSHDYSPDECQKFRFNAGTDAWAENMSLMFTFRGIPCLYYGSEIEFQKGKPIDPADGDFRVPFAESGRAYYGDHLEGTVTASDFGVYEASGTVKDTLEQPLAKHVRALNMIRRAIPALQMGQYSTEGCNGSFAFKRRYTKDGIDSMALVSISGGATFSGVPNGRWVDVISGDTQTGTTVVSSAVGKGNLRVYVLDGEKIEGLDSPFIK
jgi:glycosidase